MLEGQDCCAAAAILRNAEAKLTARRDDHFIPVLVRGCLRELEENGAMSKESFLRNFPIILHYDCELLAGTRKAHR